MMRWARQLLAPGYTLTVTAVCASLLAVAVGEFVLDDHAVGAMPVARPVARPVAPPARGSLAELLRRNVFCSNCEPSVALAAAPDVILIATSVISPTMGWATVAHRDGARQGAYGIGDEVPGVGRLVEVRPRQIGIMREGQVVWVGLRDAAPAPQAPVMPHAAPAGDELSQLAASAVRQVNPRTFEIDRALADQVLANPLLAIKSGIRIYPHIVDGKVAGVKLSNVTRGSAFAQLGLANGDVLTEVNGMAIDSAQKGLEIFSALRQANAVDISLLRRQAPLQLAYRIK